MDFASFMKAAAEVRPSARQKNWFDLEMYAFVHFTVNTYTGLEWGTGKEDEAIFNPVDLDCDEWVRAVKAAGLKGLILTAKHHDGFCLWPSKYTEHCVRNSPWKNGKGDVVREAADACRRGGIKFGVYLSPWDRNSPCYGTEAYNDYYCHQLEELLTGYGELFEVWFDGACGEGPNGKKQVYDFDRYIALIRKYQPNAVIFNDGGPDVRWCGNEAGTGRAAEWAVVPRELCFRAEVQTGAGPLEGELTGIYNTDPDIGFMPQILYSKGLCFTPSEFDTSIRPGWFYHPDEQPHSLERLMNIYLTSVGGNGNLNLNIPPMPSGRFDPRDIARLKEFGDAVRAAFKRPLPLETEVRPISETQCEMKIRLAQPEDVHYLVLAEDLDVGQRIESFTVAVDGRKEFAGSTVGHKKICRLTEQKGVRELTVRVTAARAMPVFSQIQVF